MSYNKQYNTRKSGRFNNPGQFVSAGEQQQSMNASPLQSQPPPHISRPMLQTADLDVKPELQMDTMDEDSGTVRPPWMKSKLAGVKKISNKERRRRQNENLRRLLTPKNALMVLNEMLPNEQIANQFKVEPAANQYYKPNSYSFCADLTVEGNSYKGYGENKLSARNAAAEQAIRDLIIRRMSKVLSADGLSASGGNEGGAGGSGAGDSAAGEGGAGEEESLPMIQLASFALHKLFSEWEYEGHKVPQLKPPVLTTSECAAELAELGAAAGAAGVGAAAECAPRPRAPKKPKEVPSEASAMHPCMLLTYMRPSLAYRELAVDGDRPQNMFFTMGVDVDGATYIGKAQNKKEARKAAARAACQALFGVSFNDTPANTGTVAGQ